MAIGFVHARPLSGAFPPFTASATTHGIALATAVSHLPMRFELNQGQTDRRVRFLARTGGATIFLTDAGAVFALPVAAPTPHQSSAPAFHGTLDSFVPAPHQPITSLERFGAHAQPHATALDVLRLSLVGANSHPRVVGTDRLPGITNYFIGNDPHKWCTNIPSYARVTYRSVYPGVDLIYYGNQGRLEYDFVVRPGANPNGIHLAMAGARQVRLDARGNLLLGSLHATLEQGRPHVYQVVNGQRRVVGARYVLGGTHDVRFATGAYDLHQPLVIDPVLLYSTYLGGSADDYGYGIAVDGAGSAYITGWTASTNFPTFNALRRSTFGDYDAFVTTLNAAGSALLYSTYLGGRNNDYGNGIAVDSAGNAYITGATGSADFPTFGALQKTSHGHGEAFIAKLNAAGNVLLYSTYLGGRADDYGNSIAVDKAGNAYITGQTNSVDFPTRNALQSSLHGGWDVFVTELNAAGSALLYSTYLGGHTDDWGNGIAVDGAGDAYITGWTTSTNFPTHNALQTRLHGTQNAFAAKLDPAGSALLYSTYVGGSSNDYGNSIAVDRADNAYITGATDSPDFPVVNARQASLHGGWDAFVVKLSADGRTSLYSTYLGGHAADYGYGIAVDSAGNAYISGDTLSTDFPLFQTLQQAKHGDKSEAFVVKLSADGRTPLYSTYLGGRGGDYGRGIAVDGAGNAYVTGATSSPDFSTAHALQGHFAGGEDDAFVAKLSDGAASPAMASHRYVILLDGINSHNGLASTVFQRVADHTVIGDFGQITADVKAKLPGTRLLYFSYRAGPYLSPGRTPSDAWSACVIVPAPENCQGIIGDAARIYDEPVYTASDTRDSDLDVHARGLDWLLATLVQRDPRAEIDLIGYSLGGTVAALWAARYGGPTSIIHAHIHAIVLLDSPVGGFAAAGAFIKGCTLADVTCNTAAYFLKRMFGLPVLRNLQLPQDEVRRGNEKRKSIIDELPGAARYFDLTSIQSTADYLVNGRPLLYCRRGCAGSYDVPIGVGSQYWVGVRQTLHIDQPLGGPGLAHSSMELMPAYYRILANHSAPLTDKAGSKLVSRWVVQALMANGPRWTALPGAAAVAPGQFAILVGTADPSRRSSRPG